MNFFWNVSLTVEHALILPRICTRTKKYSHQYSFSLCYDEDNSKGRFIVTMRNDENTMVPKIRHGVGLQTPPLLVMGSWWNLTMSEMKAIGIPEQWCWLGIGLKLGRQQGCIRPLRDSGYKDDWGSVILSHQVLLWRCLGVRGGLLLGPGYKFHGIYWECHCECLLIAVWDRIWRFLFPLHGPLWKVKYILLLLLL